MNWIKVYSKHYIGTNLSLIETGAMIKIQLLTAHLERIPTQKEIFREVPEKTYNALAGKLEAQSTTVAEVLEKVCDDVASVLHNRCEGSARKRKQRTYAKKDNMSSVTPPPIDKIRLDKIRLDTNIILDFFNKCCSKTLKLTTEREKIIHQRIKDGISIDNLKKAILNFSKDDWIDRDKYCDILYAIGKQKGKPDNFDKWFNFAPKNKSGVTVNNLFDADEKYV